MAIDHAPHLELDDVIDEDLIDYDSEIDQEAVATLPEASKLLTPPGNAPSSSTPGVTNDPEAPQILRADPDSIDFGVEPDLMNAVTEPHTGNNLTLLEDTSKADDLVYENETLPEQAAESFDENEENEISWEDGEDENGNESRKHSVHDGNDGDAPASNDFGAKQLLDEEISYEYEEVAEIEDDMDGGDQDAGDYFTHSVPEKRASEEVDGSPDDDISGPGSATFLPNENQDNQPDALHEAGYEGENDSHDIFEAAADPDAGFNDYNNYPEDGDIGNGESSNDHLVAHDGERTASPMVTDREGADTNVMDVQTLDKVIPHTNGTPDTGSVDEIAYDANPGTESSVASPHVSTEVNIDVPAITVSYKSVEYPLFYNSPSSDGKQCFFDDLGLLNCKVEVLLASFRRELADELSPFDELVFQVDELGLEFAESTHQGLLSEITLKAMVELFDQLLKNQDPDGSKPLYAYLVTRPNCKKRWESLIDDAYTGKGLDEVCYYFQSPGHSDNIDEVLEQIANSHHDAEESTSQEGSEAPFGDNYSDSANEPEYQVGDEEMTEQGENSNYGNDGEENVQAAEDEPSMDLNVTAEDAEATITSFHEPAVIGLSETDLTVETPEGEFAEEETNPTTGYNAPEHDGTSDPLLQWEGDEVDQFGDEQVEIDDETELPAADQNTTGAENNSASKVTPNTSATSTMNGDDETAFGNDLEINVDHTQNDIENTEASVLENGLDEIDWRDFPGEGDDEASRLSPSTTGKRPRSDEDDLLDNGDEKDVKRRRS